jgi:hypothetical protein
MKEIIFYRSASGKCPVEDFLDSLPDKQVTKILWVFRLIRDLEFIPKEYFKKLVMDSQKRVIRSHEKKFFLLSKERKTTWKGENNG